MNKKFFIFVLAAAGVILTSFLLIPKYRAPQISQTESVSEPSLQSATLVIDYGDSEPQAFSMELNEGSTAFSLLQNMSETQNIPLTIEQYDFGVFVNSIGGKESSAKMAWIYFVNGESGTVAADQMKINPGDTVEWKYIEPSGE